MGRGKLTLELIGKEKTRKSTFEKRKKGLIKKARELSILCGVDTCMIVYGTPAITDRPEEPDVWPADGGEAERIIQRYLSVSPDQRSKRSVGLRELFNNRRRKLEAELVKARTAVWEAKYPVSDDLIAGLSVEQLRSLFGILGHRLEGAKKQLAALKEKELAVAARDNVDMMGTAGFGHHHSGVSHNYCHAPYYLHGNDGRIDMRLPYHQYIPNPYVGNLPFSPNPALPLELMGTGFGGSGAYHPSQTHDDVAPLDARLLTGNNLIHHCNYQMHNFGGANQYQYPEPGGFPAGMHEHEPSAEFGGGNIGYCDSSLSGPYYDLPPAMKQIEGRVHQQIPGRIHQLQFEMMNMRADPSTAHHQRHPESPFDQFTATIGS